MRPTHDSGPRVLRAILRKAGAAAMSFLLFVVLAEVALRLFAPQPFFVLEFGDVYEPDPVTGYRLRPGATSRSGHIRINSLGFRDREYSVTKPPGARRVLVLGDSYTFGVGRLEDVYTKVAEGVLNAGRGSPGIEILSVGVPGWGTDEELEWLKRDGLRLEPDIVVVGFYVGNDVHDNRSLAEKIPVHGHLVAREKARYRASPTGRLMLRGRAALERLHLFRACRNLVGNARIGKRARDARRREDEGVGVRENTEAMVEVYDRRLWVFEVPVPQALEAGWRRTEGILREMHDVLAEHDVPLAVFVIPEQTQVNARLLARLRERGKADRTAEIDLALPQKRIAALADEIGFEVIDPLPRFVERGRSETLYFRDNAHWNPAGNRLAGSFLAQELVRRGLVPNGS